MIAPRPDGPQEAALKYDVLTLLGVIGLGGPASAQASMIRLITLITARYNWRSGEITVGRREIARLWCVDERTVKREMARLKAMGFVVLRRPGVRGRVAAYGLDFEAIRAACDCDRVGPDFAARMAVQSGQGAGGQGSGEAAPALGGNVIAFRAHAAEADAAPSEPPSEWSAARQRLRALGEAVHARWIAPLARAGREDARLTLEAPSRYHAAYVERTHLDAILRALRAVDPAISAVRLTARET